MGESEKYLKDALGIRIPEEYAAFMEKYGNKLAATPSLRKAGFPGLEAENSLLEPHRRFVPGYPASPRRIWLSVGWV